MPETERIKATWSQFRAFRKATKDPEAELLSLDDQIKIAKLNNYNTDITLKLVYAIGFILILIGQLYFMNYIFYLVGIGGLEYKGPDDLKIFMSGTLAEVFGVVFVITRYLFSKKD